MENKIKVVQQNAEKILANVVEQGLTEEEIAQVAEKMENSVDFQLKMFAVKMQKLLNTDDAEVIENILKNVTEILDTAWGLSKIIAIKELLSEENENE